MGFRCPICLEDFGKDREKWGRHCKDKHDGLGKDAADLVREMTTKKRGTK